MRNREVQRINHCSQTTAGNAVLKSSIPLHPFIGVLGCILMCIIAVDMLPLHSSGEKFYFIAAICLSVFGIALTVLSVHRFRIDKNGITVNRMIFPRFIPWTDVKKMVLMTRKTADRTVECVVFCLDSMPRPMNPKAEFIDIKRNNNCVCLDLNSTQFPADKQYAYINKEGFLRFIDLLGLELTVS